MSIRDWKRTFQAPDVFKRYVEGEGNLYHEQFYQPNVEPALDANTRVRNETNGRLANGMGRKVGSIPASIAWDWQQKWIKEGRLIPGDPDFSRRYNDLLKEKLKDRDFAKFRTTEHI